VPLSRATASVRCRTLASICESSRSIAGRWLAPLSGLSRNRASARSTSIIGASNARSQNSPKLGLHGRVVELC
jgi:hypothetical protein